MLLPSSYIGKDVGSADSGAQHSPELESGIEEHPTTGTSSTADHTSSEDGHAVKQITGGVTCDWRGELGQLENHLQTEHGGDKRWKACSGYDEPSPQTQQGRRVCVFHLNHGMRVMNMGDGSRYHHHVHGSQPVASDLHSGGRSGSQPRVATDLHSGGRRVSNMGGDGGHYHSHVHGSQPLAGAAAAALQLYSERRGASNMGGLNHQHHVHGSQPLAEGAVTSLQHGGERVNRHVSTISTRTDESRAASSEHVGPTGTSQQSASEHYLTGHHSLEAPLDDERHVVISEDLNQNPLLYDQNANRLVQDVLAQQDTPVHWYEARDNNGGEVPTEPHLMPAWDLSSQQQVPPRRCRFHGPPRMGHTWSGGGPRFRNPGRGQASQVHVIGPHPHGPHPHHYRPHGPPPMQHHRPHGPAPMHHHGPHHHGHRPHPHHHDSYDEAHGPHQQHPHRPHPHHGHHGHRHHH